MPTTEDFMKALADVFFMAEKYNLAGVLVRSGNLHKLVGGYTSTSHRMRACCGVMRRMKNSWDIVLKDLPKGEGANLEILYKPPYKKDIT